MYRSLVYADPFSTVGSALSVALIAFALFPTTNAPTAAPPMMISSFG